MTWVATTQSRGQIVALHAISQWDFSFQILCIQSIVGEFHSFLLCAPKKEVQTTEGKGEIEGNGQELPGNSNSRNPVWHSNFPNFVTFTVKRNIKSKTIIPNADPNQKIIV